MKTLIQKDMAENNYTTEKYPLTDLTGKIIKCAHNVHKQIGNGFHEIIYKRPLAVEFFFQDVPFEKEFEILHNKEGQVGKRQVDFFVDGIVMVELKSTIQLEDEHVNQTTNYLEANNLEVGLLINFGNKSLDFKQIINKKYQSPS